MSARQIAVDVLLWLAVAGEVICVVGFLAGRAAIDRLHYAGAATTVPAFLVAAAIVVENGGTQPAVNAIVVSIFVVLLGGVLSHATGRLIRVRTVGKVGPRPEERIE